MTMEELIENYRIPEDAKEQVRQAKIVLLVGISGAGKDTIKHALLKRAGFYDIVSHTTRQPRANEGVMERDGVDYHFSDLPTVRRMLKNGDFVEAKVVHGGTIYGTTVAEVSVAGSKGIAITDLEVQGVADYKAISDAVVAIFIIPPNFDEWIRRLKRRYATEAEFIREWPKRRDSAIRELEAALALPYYHYLINDNLDEAIARTELIASESGVIVGDDEQAKRLARELLVQIKT